MNVVGVVMVVGWWRWVCGSSSGDWVMACVSSLGSSGGLVLYIITGHYDNYIV